MRRASWLGSFILRIANSMVGFNFVSLKKQVIEICLILHISEFPHFFGDFITLTIGASMYFWSVCLTGQFKSYKNYVIGAVDGGEGVCSRTLEDIGGEGD